jgi:hypothetical protein
VDNSGIVNLFAMINIHRVFDLTSKLSTGNLVTERHIDPERGKMMVA